MANTYSALHYHVIFSTKDRQAWIDSGFDNELWAYMAGICQTKNWCSLRIGGTADHVHLLIGLPATIAIADAVKVIKANSSKWVHEEFRYREHFAWQQGYGAFSVSKSAIDDVTTYIRGQHEHHKIMTFRDEYLAFLKRHDVDYDERYVFG